MSLEDRLVGWLDERMPVLANRVARRINGGPVHWLTMAGTGSPATVSLYEYDGKTYIIRPAPPITNRMPFRWWTYARPTGGGTLTAEGVTTDVTLTEVTDPAEKHEIATLAIAKNGKPHGFSDDETYTLVFEVTPT